MTEWAYQVRAMIPRRRPGMMMGDGMMMAFLHGARINLSAFVWKSQSCMVTGCAGTLDRILEIVNHFAFTQVRQRIGHARLENVGKSQSCMVSTSSTRPSILSEPYGCVYN